MKGTIVALPVYGAVCKVTKDSVKRLGAPVLELHGCSDIAMARNRLLTSALTSPLGKECDVVLCVDADMVFTYEAASELVERARATGRAWSAVYSSASGSLCAAQRDDLESWHDPITGVTYPGYLCGMGLMAIPVPLLRKLAGELVAVRGPNGMIVPFCSTGPRYEDAHGQPMVPYWESEDYSLSRRLGGVLLAPVPAGHEKPVPLWPDSETLEVLARGGQLPKQPDTYSLECPLSVGSVADEHTANS